ncbi:hypothetical protein B0H14DRAFT_2584455 [Mycena olivaceomarginata]|nr:hypothetical protein B0H14DRAFT_2584455 [Mycena olivaceomarginata]
MSAMTSFMAGSCLALLLWPFRGHISPLPMDLLKMTWFGPANEEDAATLTQHGDTTPSHRIRVGSGLRGFWDSSEVPVPGRRLHHLQAHRDWASGVGFHATKVKLAAAPPAGTLIHSLGLNLSPQSPTSSQPLFTRPRPQPLDMLTIPTLWTPGPIEGPELEVLIKCLQTLHRKSRFGPVTLSQILGRLVFELRFVPGTPASPEEIAASFVDQKRAEPFGLSSHIIGFEAALAVYTAHYPQDTKKWVEVPHCDPAIDFLVAPMTRAAVDGNNVMALD